MDEHGRVELRGALPESFFTKACDACAREDLHVAGRAHRRRVQRGGEKDVRRFARESVLLPRAEDRRGSSACCCDGDLRSTRASSQSPLSRGSATSPGLTAAMQRMPAFGRSSSRGHSTNPTLQRRSRGGERWRCKGLFGDGARPPHGGGSRLARQPESPRIPRVPDSWCVRSRGKTQPSRRRRRARGIVACAGQPAHAQKTPLGHVSGGSARASRARRTHAAGVRGQAPPAAVNALKMVGRPRRRH